MFDIAPSEFLLIAIVAIVVIGPKDLPMALRTAGRWIARIRRVSGHFRSGIETMIREAEMEEMERKWREQNAAIMAASATSANDPPAALPHDAPAHEAPVPDPAHEPPAVMMPLAAAHPIDPAIAAHAPTYAEPAPHTEPKA